MLITLRKLSQTFIVKIFLVLIIIAFIFTGASSYVGMSNRSSAVATVGDTEIPLRYFNLQLQTRRSQNPDADLSMLKSSVLQDLVQQQLLLEEANALQLSISDDIAIEKIKQIPDFHDDKGEFDIVKYRRMLRHSDLSEAMLVDDIKRSILIQMVIDSIRNHAAYSEEEAKVLYQYFNELRNVNYIEVPANLIKVMDNPTDAVLQKYYETNQGDYVVPELRDIDYVVLNCQEVDLANIKEEEVKQEYERLVSIGDYITPEQRQLHQMLFKTREEAQQALDQVNETKDFLAVAAEIKQQHPQETALGRMTQSGLLEVIAKPVFLLDEQKYTGIIQSPLGFHILYVEAIVPETTIPYQQVQQELQQKMFNETNCGIAREMFTSIEDELAGGARLKEIAAQTDYLDVKTIRGITASGQDSSGNAKHFTLVEDNEEETIKQQFLTEVFSVEESLEEPITYNPSEELFIAIHVTDITEARIRALDEIKGKLIHNWKQDQSSYATYEALRQLETQINSGKTSLKQFASKHQLSLENEDIKRVNDPFLRTRNFPENFLHEMFKRIPRKSTSPYKTMKGNYIIGVLQKVKEAEDNPQIMENVRNQLRSLWFENIMDSYLKDLQEQYPVQTNASLIGLQ